MNHLNVYLLALWILVISGRWLSLTARIWPPGLTRRRSVVVQVETIASYLPGSEPEDGVIQGISHGGNLDGIRKDGLAALDEQHEIQRVDGLQRKVAWAAEDSIQEGVNDSTQEGPPCSTLLGERQPDGTFAPIGRLYEGRPNVVPDDVPLVRMRSFSNRSFH